MSIDPETICKPWAEVRASLYAVRWDELERELLKAYQNRGRELVTGDWMRLSVIDGWMLSGGTWIGDERVTSWCWCHSYQRCFAERSDEEGIRELMVELRAVWAWYDAVSVYLERLGERERGACEDEEYIAQLVREAVEFVIGQGIYDSWYSLISPVVYWSFEVCDISLSHEAFERCVELPLERHFRSWVAPSREDIIAFGDEVAFAAVLTLFEQLYPSQDTSDSES